jgi:hypothetical protein
LRSVFLKEHVELRDTDIAVSGGKIVWDVETKRAELSSFADDSVEHEQRE